MKVLDQQASAHSLSCGWRVLLIASKCCSFADDSKIHLPPMEPRCRWMLLNCRYSFLPGSGYVEKTVTLSW